MNPNDFAEQLHDKATRDTAFSPEEQAHLARWYACQDHEEHAMLAGLSRRDSADPGKAVTPYEKRLALDSRWALSEGSKFFEGKSAVQEALRKITARLHALGIDYAVAGGMALFNHGFRRFTEDVDLLVTRAGIKQIHRELEGLGYLPPFEGSKNLRDTETGVKIEFLVTGEYPGDGQPKPVAFPNPAEAAVENDGILYLKLPILIELKLASGMTNPERMKDLADVQELIKILNLPAGFADNLHPFVRDKFAELWKAARPPMKRYVRIWRNKLLTLETKSLEELIATLQEAAADLQAMRADGVVLEPEGATADDHATLVTTDPSVAQKYGMHDESEFLDRQADDEPGGTT